MEELFIETENGKIPIAPDMIEKQNLKKGMLSPFTRHRIVGANNDFPSEASKMQEFKNETKLNQDPENTVNVTLSTSEVIDFSEGLDSHTEQ